MYLHSRFPIVRLRTTNCEGRQRNLEKIMKPDMSILFHLSPSLFLGNSIAKNNLKTKLRTIMKYPLMIWLTYALLNFLDAHCTSVCLNVSKQQKYTNNLVVLSL